MKNIVLNLVFLTFLNFISAQKVVEIPANSSWVDSGVTFSTPGMVFSNGYATSWPNSNLHIINWSTPAGNPTSNFVDGTLNTTKPCKSCPATSLIGKLGTTGTPFYIGERVQIKGTGRLYLMVNDNPVSDNRGKYVALVYPSNASPCNSNIVKIANSQSNNYEILSEDDSNLPNLLKEIDLSKESNLLLQISPNPSSNKFSLIINDLELELNDIHFYTNNGNEVKSIKFINKEIKGDSQILNFNSNDSSKGIIFVSINKGNENISEKVIIK